MATDVETRPLEVMGLRTRVLEAGEGVEEAVVFIHGGPGSANDWDELLPHVGEFARAVAFDLPGFGEADKPSYLPYSPMLWAAYIAAVLERLEVRRVHLVLHDLGGEAGLRWGIIRPDTFASAILINTGPLIGYRWHAIGRLHRTPLVGQVAALTGGLGLRATMRIYEPGLPREPIKRWRREYDLGTRRAILRFYRAAPPTAMGAIATDLRRLDRPALVIWGARNRFVPVEQAERQRQSFPSANVVVLDDCGHYAQLEKPRQVADHVLPFLRKQLR
jgi:pimeloyl-ACP methyl ester carboxylesterase